jgi:hypothetical protein
MKWTERARFDRKTTGVGGTTGTEGEIRARQKLTLTTGALIPGERRR